MPASIVVLDADDVLVNVDQHSISGVIVYGGDGVLLQVLQTSLSFAAVDTTAVLPTYFCYSLCMLQVLV